MFEEPTAENITLFDDIVSSSLVTCSNTVTGDVAFPFPNCPLVFKPQLYIFPSFVIAKDVAFPALIYAIFSKSTNSSLAFIILPVIKILLAVVDDCANCPLVFKPHIYTFPSSFSIIV